MTQLIKLTAAKANVAGHDGPRQGTAFLVLPDDILQVEAAAIYADDGSYDGSRSGSRLILRNHCRPDEPTVAYSVETPAEIAALIGAAGLHRY